MMAAPDLPEPLIHRIQSLLTTQKSAETAVLSKSWLSAWSTRPSIDLDQSLFPTTEFSRDRKIKESLFTAFAAQTFRRYEDLDLRIHSFSLRLITEIDSDLVADWTSRALKLGAVDFIFRSGHSSFRSEEENRDCSLPIILVLGSDSRSLHLDGSYIHRLKSIECTTLKSLALSNMDLSIDSLFRAISCCPSIEHLSLNDVLRYNNDDYEACSSIGLLNLTSLNLLNIHRIHLPNLFREDLLSVSKFPNLKELTLTLYLNDNTETIIPLISSRSLEVFNLTIRVEYRAKPRAELEIDAPRIRKLTFDCWVVPKFSLSSSNSRDGLECRVKLSSCNYLCADWLCELREFLKSMAGSSIRLCLNLRACNSFDYLPGDIEFLNVCELEDLTMEAVGFPSMSLYAVLDVLFRMCHPKTITQYMEDDEYENRRTSRKSRRKSDEILCRVVEQGMQGKFGLWPSQYMYGLCELEEINAEKLWDDQVVWMPHPFDSVSGSTSDDRQSSRFRFQLKWKPSPS